MAIELWVTHNLDKIFPEGRKPGGAGRGSPRSSSRGGGSGMCTF